MAIDADLSAGLLTEDQARERREEVTREADFYGAMDGASKFVRGDAIAGLIITAVNILGGFAIAMLMYDYTGAEALQVFGMLSIGDGLVSQIPAFIVAIAAGLIVARAGTGQNIGMEIPAQLASQPTALFLIGGFLGLLALTPLPTLPLLGAGVLIAGIGWTMRRMRSAASVAWCWCHFWVRRCSRARTRFAQSCTASRFFRYGSSGSCARQKKPC